MTAGPPKLVLPSSQLVAPSPANVGISVGGRLSSARANVSE